MAEGHVLFLWSPSGYELRDAPGEPPEVGAEVEHEGVRFQVTKLGPSPLPRDARLCAYLSRA